MDREAIDWVFSTAPQTLGVFVGLIMACVTFIYSRIDGIVEKDETLREIYDSIKKDIYKEGRMLLFLALASIFADLFILFVNPLWYNLNSFLVFIILVGILNIFTVYYAILYVLSIINHKTVENKAKSLYDKAEEIRKIAIAENARKIAEREKRRKINEKTNKILDINAIRKTRVNYRDYMIKLEESVTREKIEEELCSNKQLISREVLFFYISELVSYLNDNLFQMHTKNKDILSIAELLLHLDIINGVEYNNLVVINSIYNYSIHGDVMDTDRYYVDRLIEISDKIKSRIKDPKYKINLLAYKYLRSLIFRKICINKSLSSKEYQAYPELYSILLKDELIKERYSDHSFYITDIGLQVEKKIKELRNELDIGENPW